MVRAIITFILPTIDTMLGQKALPRIWSKTLLGKKTVSGARIIIFEKDFEKVNPVISQDYQGRLQSEDSSNNSKHFLLHKKDVCLKRTQKRV